MNLLNPGDPPSVTVQVVANGFLVTGAYSFARERPVNGPADWFVFENFSSLVEHLRKTLKPTGAGQ